MKNHLLSILFTLLSFMSIYAQSLTGEYFITATGGEIVLRLQVAGQNRLTGTMTDLQGIQYQVQGIVEEGDASGTITSAQGGMYFEAYREGNQLFLTLIPPAANQQPDYNQAQEYAMTARNGGGNSPANVFPNAVPSNPGGVSGPLGGNSGTPAAGWAGNYNGNINGTPATLTLQQNGNQLSGQINAGGYLYKLSGNISGNQSQGQLTDPQTQGVMSYQGVLQGANIQLSLNANGSQLQLQFSKGAASAGAGSFNQAGNPGQGTNTGNANPGQGDPRLIGNWLYTDSYTSGEFSFATQYRMIVNADGTYLYGDGKVAGGGPGVSGSSGGSGMTTGKWKTEGDIIYIDEGYGWQAYARYYVEGASLMLTFGDGSRQVWKR